ncbi:IS4 family transposase [Noviherbaspirillum sp. CPCC 100848]|uniref:IS4 family transposase n=1 Tax=Noviherbaspirillum album TaxID=3080276 RepID=A0ABU6J1W3_9BURK|nr:IS4 family transposase [Noviherbaspirillum sp. CPCC 100848]MEC4717605.1 IS4 family transposase [Noviherbaspirillum sp. CPCC 100848]
MARLTMQRALEPNWINELFEQERGLQYTRQLLFSTTVELMSVVAVGLRPSLHAAAKACKDLPVSLQALYDKINGISPSLVRALVQGSATRLNEVLAPMLGGRAPMVPGYELRIVDGNHLPASEKRLKPLRGFRGAALQGQSLVVYDPDTDLVVDMLPCADGHAQERTMMQAVQQQAKPGQLWIADRNFSTRSIFCGWQERGSCFIVPEHGRTPSPLELDAMQLRGKIETGIVHEQAVSIENDQGKPIRLRRVELHLERPTEDGDTVIRLLTNLPAWEFTARSVARLYRCCWRIESLFQRLEAVLHSEVASLGHPRAALFAFGVAVMAYNVLAVLQSAVWVAHDLQDSDVELSSYCFADEIRTHYAGMVMAVIPIAWEPYDSMTAAQLAEVLLQIALHANPKSLRKHIRGPKPSAKKGYVSGAVARRHVATARVLKNGLVK